jgi:hypothetical protein
MTALNTMETGRMMFVTGKGVFEYTNGDKYDGDWADDIQHGKGT